MKRRPWDLDGQVLLLGVPYGNNTSFHLGEYRAPGGKQVAQGAPITENGQRVWKTFTTLEVDSDCFDELGTDFEKVQHVKIRVGGLGDGASDFAASGGELCSAVDDREEKLG